MMIRKAKVKRLDYAFKFWLRAMAIVSSCEDYHISTKRITPWISCAEYSSLVVRIGLAKLRSREKRTLCLYRGFALSKHMLTSMHMLIKMVVCKRHAGLPNVLHRNRLLMYLVNGGFVCSLTSISWALVMHDLTRFHFVQTVRAQLMTIHIDKHVLLASSYV